MFPGRIPSAGFLLPRGGLPTLPISVDFSREFCHPTRTLSPVPAKGRSRIKAHSCPHAPPSGAGLVLPASHCSRSSSDLLATSLCSRKLFRPSFRFQVLGSGNAKARGSMELLNAGCRRADRRRRAVTLPGADLDFRVTTQPGLPAMAQRIGTLP